MFEGAVVQGRIGSSGEDIDGSSTHGYYVRTQDFIKLNLNQIFPDNHHYISLSFVSRMNAAKVFFYSEDRSLLSYKSKSTGVESVSPRLRELYYEVPNDSYYIRIMIYGSSGTTMYSPKDITSIQVEDGQYYTGYESPLSAKDSILEDRYNGLLSKSNALFINLYDKDTIETGCYYYNGRIVNYTYSASDFIEVTPNTDYVFGSYYSTTKKLTNLIFEQYDRNKNMLSYGTQVSSIHTSMNCMYIRVSSTTVRMRGHGIVVCKGSAIDDLPEFYVPYQIDVLKPDSWDLWNYAHACGDILCIGDSITAGLYAPTSVGVIKQNYPYQLSRILNANVTNAGIPGETPKEWLQNEYSRYNYLDYDTIIMWLGSNGGMNYADISDTDSQVYAYKSIIQNILTSNPNIHIFCLTVYATGSNGGGAAFDTVQDTNVAIQNISTEFGTSVTIIDFSDIDSYNHPELHNSVIGDTHLGKAGFLYVAKRITEKFGIYFYSLLSRCEFGVSNN